MNSSIIDRYLNLQRETVKSHRQKNIDTRLNLLRKLKKGIEEYQDQIHLALKNDLGKCEAEAYLSETNFVLQEISYVLGKLKKWSRPKKMPTPLVYWPGKSEIHYAPFGMVLIIGPWNYPFQLLMSPLIGALAAGNVAVLKPSEISSHTSKVVKLMIEAEFDPSEICVVEGGAEETSYLLDQKFDYIFYTGSTRVGKIVMNKAAQFLTPVTLELGGKSPCVVMDDIDLDIAVKRIIWGKFFNTGQTCVAPDYLLIHEKIYDAFVAKSKEIIESFYPKSESSPDYGRIINHSHFKRLVSYLEGAKVVLGGKFVENQKFISPTFLLCQGPEKIMEEEIFGPILPLIKIKDINQAISLINEKPHPLALYLFSNSKNYQKLVLEKTQSGGVCLNDTVVHMSGEFLPFGGVGESGMGQYHGQHSFETFSHKRAVMKKIFPFDLFLRYPPYGPKLKLIKIVLKLVEKISSIF